MSYWSSNVCSADLDARRGELEHFLGESRADLTFEDQAQLAGAGDAEIGRLILVAECVTADDDRVGPAGDEARDVLHHDRFAEHDAAQNVADRAVRRLPHLLEAEFLDARRSEEHTSELQSLMRSSYAVFCLQKKKYH